MKTWIMISAGVAAIVGSVLMNSFPMIGVTVMSIGALTSAFLSIILRLNDNSSDNNKLNN